MRRGGVHAEAALPERRTGDDEEKREQSRSKGHRLRSGRPAAAGIVPLTQLHFRGFIRGRSAAASRVEAARLLQPGGGWPAGGHSRCVGRVRRFVET